MKKKVYLLTMAVLLSVTLSACTQSTDNISEEESSSQSVSQNTDIVSQQDNQPMTDLPEQSEDYESSQPEFIPPTETKISDYQSIVVNGKCRLLIYTGQENRIVVPGKVTINGKEYETEVGAGCFKEKDIISLTLPDNITEIPESMCEGCKHLEEVTFFNVQSISNKAFWQCENFKFRLDDLNGGDQTKLKKVDEWAFGFSGLYGKVVITPDMEVDNGSFQACLNVTEVEIKSGVTEIPERLFAENTSLEKITLPDTLVKIGEDAFSYNVTEMIIIPKSVTEIGYHAVTTNKVAGGKYTGIILGYKGSAAETYANENGIIFSAVD